MEPKNINFIYHNQNLIVNYLKFTILIIQLYQSQFNEGKNYKVSYLWYYFSIWANIIIIEFYKCLWKKHRKAANSHPSDKNYNARPVISNILTCSNSTRTVLLKTYLQTKLIFRRKYKRNCGWEGRQVARKK